MPQTERIDLKDLFRSYSNLITAEFDRTAKESTHALTKGEEREDIVRTFLKNNLPENIGVMKGQVFDSAGNVSSQSDLILYSKTSISFRGDTRGLFPIDSVLAVGEIKSYLKSDEIKDCIEKSSKIKEMSIRGSQVIFGGFSEKATTLVFAFDSDSVETVTKNIMAEYESQGIAGDKRIDIWCVHNKCLMVRRLSRFGMKFQPEDKIDNDSELLILNSGTDTLVLLVILMSNCINNPVNLTRDYIPYLNNLGLKFAVDRWEE
jgi:hypothetical protein